MIMKGTKYFNNSRHPVLMMLHDATFMTKELEAVITTEGLLPVTDNQPLI